MLLTVKETAEALKVNKNYVYRLIQAGLLKSLRLGSIKIRKENIEDFLKEYEGQDVNEILEKLRERGCAK